MAHTGGSSSIASTSARRGALRRLDDELVVAVKDNRPAARLGADEAAASRSRAVPCTTFSTKVPNQARTGFHWPLRIVEEFEVGIAVLELGIRHETRARDN